MFLIILFLYILQFSVQYEIETCGINKNIILDKFANNSQPIFIQSPGFPNSMTKEEIKNCEFNVTSNEANDGNFLTFVITNGNVENIETYNNYIYKLTGPMYYLVTDIPYLYMNFTDNTSLSLWNAFQGYIIYENDESCPFSSMNSFIFENESQIIYLKSHHMIPMKYKRSYLDVKDFAKIKSVSCNWKLFGPHGYGFKIVIKEVLGDIEVNAVNSTGYDIIKGYGVIQNQVYYNSDNNLNVKVIGDGYFNAYVTIVQNEWEDVEAGCEKEDNETALIWSNIGIGAYPINSKCNISIPIPQNHFVLLNVIKFAAEPYIDYLEILDCYGFKHFINHIKPSSWSFDSIPAFFPDISKDENSLELTFKSDGSVQNEGFELLFETIECTCAPNIITLPCESEHKYSILNQTNQYICPTTICNFTVLLSSTCPSKHVVLTFHQEVIKEENSFGFKIFVNDEIYLNFENITKLYHETLSIPFPPESILSFFATRNASFEIPASMDFVLMAVDPPQMLDTIKISNEIPSIKMDLARLAKNSILTVELSNERIQKNDTLEMYTAQFINLPCILLYKDKSLKRIDNTLMKMHESMHKIFSHSSITIYISLHCKASKMPVLYRAKNAHSKGCVFPENVFNRVPYNPIITQIAKPSGTCEIILLVHREFIMTKLWGSFKNGDLIMSSGLSGGETQIIHNFNKTSNHIWNNLTLDSSSFYSLLLPPNSSLYIITFFPVKENITHYKVPSKNIIDIPYFEYMRVDNETNNTTNLAVLYNNDKEEPKKLAGIRTEIYETDSAAHLHYFDITNKTKRFEPVNGLTMLKDVEFNVIYNNTNDNYIYMNKGVNFLLKPNVTIEESRKTDNSKGIVSTML